MIRSKPSQLGPFLPALTSAGSTANLRPMDTMKLLLGATVALLLGALAVSWQGMNIGVKNTSPDEIARLKKQIAELRMEQDNLELQRRLQLLKSMPESTPQPAANAAEIEAMRAQLEANQRALAEIEAERAKARDAKVEQDEEGLLEQRNLERSDSELRRARLIAEALLVGKIREYVEDAEFGSFITFDIMAPAEVSLDPGTVIAIRRKTGILSQFKIAEISPEGGIANPLPGFGEVKPQIGDELILPPPF